MPAERLAVIHQRLDDARNSFPLVPANRLFRRLELG
jgi:hypothetical protein